MFRHRIEPVILAIFFCTLVSSVSVLSLINCIVSPTGISVDEKRNLGSLSLPKSYARDDILKFVGEVERFFDDRIPGRIDLITARSYWQYVLFSKGSRDVLVGKDGWLFYKKGKAEDFLRNEPLYSRDQTNWWCSEFEKRSKWCKARGIRYLLYFPPLSSTIYPEMLPAGYKRNAENSKMDQLLQELRSHSSVRAIDLRKALIANKSRPIYLKTDTHWSFTGAFIATREILDALCDWFPNARRIEENEIDLVEADYSGDLGKMLGAGDRIKERAWLPNKNSKHLWTAIPSCLDEDLVQLQKPFLTIIPGSSFPSAVCLRDSFVISQRPYLSNHFRRILYYWDSTFPT